MGAGRAPRALSTGTGGGAGVVVVVVAGSSVAAPQQALQECRYTGGGPGFPSLDFNQPWLKVKFRFCKTSAHIWNNLGVCVFLFRVSCTQLRPLAPSGKLLTAPGFAVSVKWVNLLRSQQHRPI